MARVVIPGFRKIEVSGGGEGGTKNYNDLTNKPSINNVPLVGNLRTVDLKLTDATLTEEGVPAEAKTVGAKLEEHSTSLTALSEQLGNHTVKSDVPENAVFTDTVYDDTEVKEEIAGINSNLVDLRTGTELIFNSTSTKTEKDIEGTFQNGVYWDLEGKPVSTSVNAYRAGEFNIEESEIYSFTGVYGYEYGGVFWLDENNNLLKIDLYYGGLEGENRYKNIMLLAPKGAKKVRINGYLSHFPKCFLVNAQVKYGKYKIEEIKPSFTDNYYVGNKVEKPLALEHTRYARIDVEHGEVYIIKSCNNYEAKAYVIYDANGNCLAYSGNTDLCYFSDTVSIPKNAKTMYINGYVPSTSSTLGFTRIYKVSFDETYSNLERKRAIKWCAIGDSLTDPITLTFRNYLMPNYVDFVSEWLDIESVNLGKSGTGYISQGSDNVGTFLQRVSSVPLDSDIVSIFGSFNDLWAENYVLGDLESTDTNTVYGAIKATIEALYARNENYLVVLITPTPWSNANDMHSNNPKNPLTKGYVKAILEVGEWYGLPVVDLFHNSGMHPSDENYKTHHFLNGDGGHPLSEAHEKNIAPHIASKFKEILYI